MAKLPGSEMEYMDVALDYLVVAYLVALEKLRYVFLVLHRLVALLVLSMEIITASARSFGRVTSVSQCL